MKPEFQTLYQIELAVQAALDRPLPGTRAHLALAPRPRRGWHPGQIRPGARTAAALVLLYPHFDIPHVLLTVRAGQLAQHARQVSLPGGRLEPGETVQDAALRESFEEVGVDPRSVRTLGTLSPIYIPVSDFALHPVVSTSDSRPSLRIASDEVERILEIPLRDFLRAAGPYRGYRCQDDRMIHVPYFELGGERVWGATAMVLAELLAAIGVPPADPWSGTSAPYPVDPQVSGCQAR